MGTKYLPTTRDLKATRRFEEKQARAQPGLKKFAAGKKSSTPRKKT